MDLSEVKYQKTKKRRVRQKKLKLAGASTDNNVICISTTQSEACKTVDKQINNSSVSTTVDKEQDPDSISEQLSTKKESAHTVKNINNKPNNLDIMSSKEATDKTRDEIKAAREAKKLAKQKAKKGTVQDAQQIDTAKELPNTDNPKASEAPKCVDEVDKATVLLDAITIKSPIATTENKDNVLAERAAKKAAKQAKKKGETEIKLEDVQKKVDVKVKLDETVKGAKCKADVTAKDVKPQPDMTVKDVVETLKDIKKVAEDVQGLTAKESDGGKSKAELKAERRAKQEAQRAAKLAADQNAAAVKPVATKEVTVTTKEAVKEKSPKSKAEKLKVKSSENRVNWFQHLHTELDKEALNKIPINSNLHPAIIKLGVQLATRVVTGSNARCVALLDALKKMVRDYTLPAKTEFSRGLESHLAASLEFLWSMRQPSASQSNAIKYFRHHLTQLPNNVLEFDAKKKLQEEIDKYIEDQIDKAGEAISEAVRHKISHGDNILTYGCSSLIERILREAWEAKLEFRTVIVGNRVHNGAREMLRRLTAAGLHCTYADITAISYVMKSINKVILGASALLVNGSVLGSVGTAQVALAAKECNVPLLVACETHKFSEKVQTDAFVYNELGNPDELLDKSDPGSPLRDWRTNPNLTLLNLTYDVTPPSLVTAVVTEKAILPCTSAPVVLRTKLSEYGM